MPFVKGQHSGRIVVLGIYPSMAPVFTDESTWVILDVMNAKRPHAPYGNVISTNDVQRHNHPRLEA